MKKYKGYKIKEEKTHIEISDIKDFNLEQTFECGQCFRWKKNPDKSYTGIAYGRIINVKITGRTLIIKNTGIEDFKDIWFDYFDLGRDYGSIKKRLGKDKILKEAIALSPGIRILKQDFYEVLISFIISSNNNIPRIRNTIERICEVYGQKKTYNNAEYYLFPAADDMVCAGSLEFKRLGSGYRCEYLSKSAKLFADEYKDTDYLKENSLDKIRTQIKKFSGVGDKVADCIILFSGIRYGVFPTDVWVQRIMEELYIKSKASKNEVRKYACERFKEDAGFAQQYLFNYARINRIGARKVNE